MLTYHNCKRTPLDSISFSFIKTEREHQKFATLSWHRKDYKYCACTVSPHTNHERMGTICEGLVELMKCLTKMAANYSNTNKSDHSHKCTSFHASSEPIFISLYILVSKDANFSFRLI